MNLEGPSAVVIERAETSARDGDIETAWKVLRTGLSLRDFGMLLLEVPEKYPNLRAKLPEMPAAAVQANWAGTSGQDLLVQSLDFMTVLEATVPQIAGRPLAGMRILDYGCGWGRLSRLMYKFVPTDQVYGVDPWDESLRHCRENRLRMDRFEPCDYLPKTLPFGDLKFDLIFAFSIFTHLSEKTARIVQTTLRSRIVENGLFVATVRPPEYWKIHGNWPSGFSEEATTSEFNQSGFSFVPHPMPPVDGELTYGDTSIAIDYLKREWPHWDVAHVIKDFTDPYQVIVFFKPK